MCGEQAAGREAGRDFKATMEGRTAQKTAQKYIYPEPQGSDHISLDTAPGIFLGWQAVLRVPGV